MAEGQTAHTKFEYQQIGDILKEMETVFGEMADALSTADTKYRDAVNVEDKAIFGDLGSQLLLDWDNVSSDFPKFKENFKNWTNVVAAAGGNYTQFEDENKSFKAVEEGSDYLGVSAQKNGVHDNYINSSVFTNYANENVESYSRTGSDLGTRTYSTFTPNIPVLPDPNDLTLV